MFLLSGPPSRLGRPLADIDWGRIGTTFLGATAPPCSPRPRPPQPGRSPPLCPITPRCSALLRAAAGSPPPGPRPPQANDQPGPRTLTHRPRRTTAPNQLHRAAPPCRAAPPHPRPRPPQPTGGTLTTTVPNYYTATTASDRDPHHHRPCPTIYYTTLPRRAPAPATTTNDRDAHHHRPCPILLRRAASRRAAALYD